MTNNNEPDIREKLYREVWEEPLSTVAKKYLLSDNGLRKKCISMKIPLPPFGYWAQKRAGKEVIEKPPLPKLDIMINTSITKNLENESIDALNKQEIPSVEPIKYLSEQLLKWCDQRHVPGRVKEFDPLIEKHSKEMVSRSERKKNSYMEHLSFETRYQLSKNFVSERDIVVLNLEVSAKQRHRAYCIIQCIIDSVRELKGEVSVEVESNDNTSITIDGCHFSCELHERESKRRDIPGELSESPQSLRPIYELVPTGVFALTFISFKSTWNIKKKVEKVLSYVDEPDNKIEKQMSIIFRELLFTIAEIKKDLAEEQAQEQKRRDQYALEQKREEQRASSAKSQAASILRPLENKPVEKNNEDIQSIYNFAIKHMEKWNQIKKLRQYHDELMNYADSVEEISKQVIMKYCQKIEKVLSVEALIKEIDNF